jgi:LPXTG-motif cell wall-anchored protein
LTQTLRITTLTNGAGITSTAGGGTYLGGSNVPISAAVSGSYTWSGWTQTAGSTSVSTTNAYTIPNISSPISYTANAAPNGGPPPMIMTASLPGGTVGTAYSAGLNAASLVPLSLTWSTTVGTLPPGLSLNAGVISGTPTAAGMYSFTVQATDSNGSATKDYTINITEDGSGTPPDEPTISITGQPKDLTVAPNATAEFTVSANVSTGGTVLYQWYSNTVNSKTDGTKINGATSATYPAPTNTTGVTYYYCVVSFTGAADVATDVAKLTVTKASDNSGNLDGDVDDGGSNPVAGATVKLMKNGTDGTQFGSTVTTDKDGKFSFTDIPYGSYSLVAQKDSLTITRQITIKSKSTAEHLTMPSGAKSTRVVIEGDSTPSAAVGNLDEMFTDSDNTIAQQPGATVDITLMVEEQDSPSDKGNINAKLTKDQKVGLYLDAKLVKTISGTVADDGTENIQPPSGQTLRIVLDLPTDLQGKTGYQIIRSHTENGATDVRVISPVYDSTLKTLSFDADEFSTYAVVYTQNSNGGGGTGGGGSTGGGTEPTSPVDSASSTVPVAPSSPAASASSPEKTASQNTPAGKGDQTLPKTGEEGPWGFYGAGIALIVLGLMGIFHKNRKSHQYTEK